MLLFIFWFTLAIIVGVVANSRGRNGWGWFFLSALLLSPLLGLILVLCLTNLKKLALEKQRHDEILTALGAGPLPPPPPLPPTNDEWEIEQRVKDIKRELASYQRSNRS
ncbi:hypothetical protein GWG65_34915 [Bradyrhizobium sp. CSA207]|uniref:hypothetical protein n=1 Tax=Bradyrhizobium sp. CSA207 TaxID=2698826 RepID=UPI0023B10BFA|nr:hypothetical protein [Bradyrhizobium sp. CSA207]MDE5446465.1 hypothetical protein [Bradyrhizobium sp. CSA207]